MPNSSFSSPSPPLSLFHLILIRFSVIVSSIAQSSSIHAMPFFFFPPFLLLLFFFLLSSLPLSLISFSRLFFNALIERNESFRSMIYRDRNIRLIHSCLLLVFVNYIHNVCMRRATVLTGHDAVIDEVNRWVRCHRSNCKRITIPRHEIYIYKSCVS